MQYFQGVQDGLSVFIPILSPSPGRRKVTGVAKNIALSVPGLVAFGALLALGVCILNPSVRPAFLAKAIAEHAKAMKTVAIISSVVGGVGVFLFGTRTLIESGISIGSGHYRMHSNETGDENCRAKKHSERDEWRRHYNSTTVGSVVEGVWSIGYFALDIQGNDVNQIRVRGEVRCDPQMTGEEYFGTRVRGMTPYGALVSYIRG